LAKKDGRDVYTKDLESLLDLLGVSEQSGVLQVEQAEGEESGSPWNAQIHLVEGRVITCEVLRKEDGQVLLRDANALRWLSGLGGLVWNLAETHRQTLTSSPSPPASVRAVKRNIDPRAALYQVDRHEGEISSKQASQSQTIPRRTARGKQTPVNPAWPRDHRIIFALIDGKKTIEEIALLLHKPPGLVQQVILELRAIGTLE
jgi:hypothetical protein